MNVETKPAASSLKRNRPRLPSEEKAKPDLVFHRYGSLPPEIRWMIWEVFNEARARVFFFSLSVEDAQGKDTSSSHFNKSSARPILHITDGCNQEMENLKFLRDFTRARRFFGSVCPETRAIMLRRWPGKLEFRAKTTKPRVRRKSGVLRFDGAVDVIVLQTHPWDRRILGESGLATHDAFAGIQTLALAYSEGQTDEVMYQRRMAVNLYRPWNAPPEDCECPPGPCRERCAKDPFPKFLACFPRLETLMLCDYMSWPPIYSNYNPLKRGAISDTAAKGCFTPTTRGPDDPHQGYHGWEPWPRRLVSVMSAQGGRSGGGYVGICDESNQCPGQRARRRSGNALWPEFQPRYRPNKPLVLVLVNRNGQGYKRALRQ
ncbi:hypothetical protein MAPG_08396 [Magnaporthiopsis poae ATCC 64411]|uniref:2EXR domain-containing protein n=1 Tax=Magnaporthiopsis poae (strain ATCC 64411 / 73-15) TaxID=644358 RepID=A0A0C4E792_MAGP6|nr:hypothetical protein MAPG_08396 [Magnaporthiopsis poae ATCC 64411]